MNSLNGCKVQSGDKVDSRRLMVGETVHGVVSCSRLVQGECEKQYGI